MRWIKKTLITLVSLLAFVVLLVSFSDIIETSLAKEFVKKSNDTSEMQVSFDAFDYKPPRQIEISGLSVNDPEFSLTTKVINVDIDDISREHVSFGQITLMSPEVLIKESSRKSSEKTNDDNQNKAIDYSFSQIVAANGSVKYIIDEAKHEVVIPNLNASLTADAESNAGPDNFILSIKASDGDKTNLDLKGKLDLNSLILKSTSLDVVLDINNKSLTKKWPDAWKESIQNLNPTEPVKLNLNGTLDLKNIKMSALQGQLALDNFSLAINENPININRSKTDLRLADGHLFFDAELQSDKDSLLNLAKGDIDLTTHQAVFRTDWTVSGFDIKSLSPEEDNAAGILDSKGTLVGSLNQFKIAEGSGQFTIHSGKFINLPVITELAALLNIENLSNGRIEQNDKVAGHFTLTHDRASFSKIDVHNILLAARMKGDILYSGNLELIATAGPIEKLEIILGPIGDITNAIKRKISAYKISGTIGEPKVSRTFLGMGGGSNETIENPADT